MKLQRLFARDAERCPHGRINTDAKKLSKEMAHLIRIYAMGGDLLVNGRVMTYREYEHDLLTEIRA